MYDELVKRLRREAVYLPEKFSKNAELLDVLMKAADAIESMNKAYQMISEAYEAEVTKQNWIPVTERLPDQNSGNLYICLIVGGEYDQLSWYELCDFAEGQFWIQDQLCEGHVTHWMPLPQPPKEG